MIILFVIPFVLSLVLTPGVQHLAIKIGAVDIPNNRKVHSKPIPRIGGLALACSLVLSLIMIYLFPLQISIEQYIETSDLSNYAVVIAAAGSIFLLGFRDDLHSLSPAFKFMVQIMAAVGIYYAGINITSISHPFGEGAIELGHFALPVTVFWVVGITNAFNLIDGLDGLAGGTAIIALVTMGVISFINNLPLTMFFCVLLAGATAGFLRYNFRPASIFLGDSGSLLLGFSMAILSVQSYSKASTSFALLIPILVLGFPILDTSIAMIRRYLAWFLPTNQHEKAAVSFRAVLHSIFQPDKSHIHHKLLNMGFSHRNTVLVLYAVSLLFGSSAVLINVVDEWTSSLHLMLFLLAVIIVGVGLLRYHEIALFHNGILLNLYKNIILRRAYLRRILDGIFTLLALTGAWYTINAESFTTAFQQGGSAFLSIMALMLISQQLIFLVSGFYRETIQGFCISDVIKISQSVFFTVLVSYIFFTWVFPAFNPSALSFYVLEFYLLFTLILGMRVTFHVLSYLYSRSVIMQANQARTIIYGTGKQARQLTDYLLNSDYEYHNIIGFLDKSPNMENKKVMGYPVFGGHWKFENLIKTKHISKLIIADPDIHPIVEKRLARMVATHEIELYKYSVEIKKQDTNHLLLHENHDKSEDASTNIIYAK